MTESRKIRFANKVVVVTGAAGGIGGQIVSALAREGAAIAMIDRDREKMEMLAGQLELGPDRSAVEVADVSDRDQIQGAVGRIVAGLGPIDVMVHCAGIARASTVDDLNVAEAEDVIATNLFGLAYAVEAVLPAMIERGQGHIVGISSLAGIRGIPYEPAYAASKAAVAVYLESLRAELRPRAIAVTTVLPGFVQTTQLDEINQVLGADMSGGNALSAGQAAARVVEAIARRRSVAYLPRGLGLAARLSLLLPPRLYDRIMRRRYARMPIAH